MEMRLLQEWVVDWSLPMGSLDLCPTPHHLNTCPQSQFSFPAHISCSGPLWQTWRPAGQQTALLFLLVHAMGQAESTIPFPGLYAQHVLWRTNLSPDGPPGSELGQKGSHKGSLIVLWSQSISKVHLRWFILWNGYFLILILVLESVPLLIPNQEGRNGKVNWNQQASHNVFTGEEHTLGLKTAFPHSGWGSSSFYNSQTWLWIRYLGYICWIWHNSGPLHARIL